MVCFFFFSFSLQKSFLKTLDRAEAFIVQYQWLHKFYFRTSHSQKKEPDFLFHTSLPFTHPPKTDYSVFKNRKCGCVNKENTSKLLPTDSHSQSLLMSFVDPFEKHHFSKVILLPAEGSLFTVKGITCKNIKNRFPLLNSRPRNITQLSSVISVIINLQICLKPKYLYKGKGAADRHSMNQGESSCKKDQQK